MNLKMEMTDTIPVWTPIGGLTQREKEALREKGRVTLDHQNLTPEMAAGILRALADSIMPPPIIRIKGATNDPR